MTAAEDPPSDSAGPSDIAPAYLVATTPQAGSDFLSTCLRRSGVAGEPAEYFVPTGGRQWHEIWGVGRDWSDYRAFVDAAVVRGAGANGVFGATLQWHQFAWLARILRGGTTTPTPAALMDEVFRRPRYLHLRREDTGRQALDYFQSICTGETRLRTNDPDPPPLPVPTVSELRFVRWIEGLLVEHDRRWTAYFARNGIEPLVVTWERLVEHPRIVTSRILGFVGIPKPDGLGRRPQPAPAELRWATTWSPAYTKVRRGLATRPPGRPWAAADRLAGPGPPVPSPMAEVAAAPGERILYSCVVDKAPLLLYQSLVWYLAITELAGVPPDQIVVHTVRGTPRRHLQRLRALGIKPVLVERFDDRNKFANKLRQLESPALAGADRVVLCDCDLALTGDLTGFIGGRSIAGTANDSGLPGYHTWLELRRRAGLAGPLVPRRGPKLLRWTYAANLNCGFVVVPSEWLLDLAEAWPRWLYWVLDNCGDFPGSTRVMKHAFQVAFGLAALELDLPVRQLPSALNLSLIPPSDDPRVSAGVAPLVLHYHTQITDDGLLRANGVAGNDEAIDSVNALLRRSEHRPLLDAALADYLAWKA